MIILIMSENQAAVHEYPITKDYGLVINCTKLQDLIADFKCFGEQYLAKTESERN